jgi:hypothetical protein
MPQKAQSGNLSLVGVSLAAILGYLSLLPLDHRLGLSIGDYFFMTNNGYTVTTRVPPEVDIQPADMRALLDQQRGSFLADGIPTYDARIDRLDRLITMLVDNKDEITATLTADFGTRSVATSLFAEVWHVVESLKYTNFTSENGCSQRRTKRCCLTQKRALSSSQKV